MRLTTNNWASRPQRKSKKAQARRSEDPVENNSPLWIPRKWERVMRE